MTINSIFYEKACEDRSKGIIVFPHAQRTGGTSLRGLITQALGRNRTYALRTVDDFKPWHTLTEDDLAEFSAYLGHANFDGRLFTRRQVFPIFIVRSPAERLYSLYFYCQTKEGHPLKNLALNHSAVDFLNKAAQLKPDYLSDTQCLRICGAKNSALAIEYLNTKFLGYSTTQNVSQFSGQLRDYFKWQVEPLKQKDTKSRENELPENFRELAEEINKQDMVLYNFVQGQI